MVSGLRRVIWMSAQTFRENVVHNRWFQLCLIGLLLFVVGSQGFSGLPLGSSASKLVYDVGLAWIWCFSSAVLAVLLSYQLMTEMQTGVVYGYLVRSLSRKEYLAGKLLGCWFALAVAIAAAEMILGVLVAAEARRPAAAWLAAASPAWTAWVQLYLLQIAELLVLGCFSCLLAALSRSFLFPAVMTLAFWLIGALLAGLHAPDPLGGGFTNFLSDLFRWLLPHFELWNFSSVIWYEGPLSLAVFAKVILVSGGYAALFFGFAAFVLERREL